MKKIFGFIGGLGLVAFSFYMTDKVSLMVANKSELMQQIKAESENYYLEPVNAIVDEEKNTIIPGKNGKEVDAEESYLNMHDFGVFNHNYLVLKDIIPNISLEDNKDKYIISGTKSVRKVSIIVHDNADVESLLQSKNVLYAKNILSAKDISSINENINIASNKTDFKEIDSKLEDNSKKICIHDYSNLELCKKYGYYILKPEITLSRYNISEVKSSIENGSIIVVDSSATTDNINLLLNEIKYKDLNIINISELISEKE